MQEVKELYFREHGGIVPGTLFQTEFLGACALRVTSGTNGPQGGDSGHGCWSYIKLEPDSGFDMELEIIKENQTPGIIIKTGGDQELFQIIDALKFITQVLENK